MKALRCHAHTGPAHLQIDELPTPLPGPGEVRIQMRAASVNFPDVLMTWGKYQVKPPVPFTLGVELAGVIEALGEGVGGLAVGQRVAAFHGGAFAEQVIAPAAVCMPLPDAIDDVTAASLILAYGTSWHALVHRAKLQAGETVLILGAAGGVGMAAIDIAKSLGARVVAAASTAEKLAQCRALGADETINYTDANWRDQLKALLGKAGAQVVYDAVGGDFAETGVRSLGWRGRYLVVGFAAGDIPRIPLNLYLLKEAEILGVFWGDWARRQPAENADMLRKIAQNVIAGTFKPQISQRFDLADAAQAVAWLGERRAVGKVVVANRGG